MTAQEEIKLVRAIGKALRQEREEYPMSQVVLGNLIGMSNKQVHKMEMGGDVEGMKVLYVAKVLSALNANFPRFIERVKHWMAQ